MLHTLSDAEVMPDLTRLFLVGDDASRAPLDLIDAETGHRLRLSPTDEVIDRYSAAVTAWLDETEAICAAEHTKYVRLLTSWEMESVVLGVLHRHGVVA